jgi:hypothetical protein
MKNHSHKEPPLQLLFNHIGRQKSNIAYYASMAFFAIVLGLAIALVFE